MAIEKLIPKKEMVQISRPFWISNTTYRYQGFVESLLVSYEYWYDNRFFLIGQFQGERRLELIEVETGASCINVDLYDIDKVLTLFKERVATSGGSIHEVVSVFKRNNLDLDLWAVNSLII